MARPRGRAVRSAKGCPCGTGRQYAICCGPLHDGRQTAATAEALMRSRYSAFAVADAEYLLRTWHSTTRPRALTLEPERRWTRLDVLAVTGGGLFDTDGAVEFRALYRRRGTAGSLREHSHFVREDGHWFYLGPLRPIV